MKYHEFEEMRKKAILYDTYVRGREAAENFRALVEDFNRYEEEIGDSTKRYIGEVDDEPWMWIDPKDKKVKRVKKVSSAGGSLVNLLKNYELREEFLNENN